MVEVKRGGLKRRGGREEGGRGRAHCCFEEQRGETEKKKGL